MVAGHTLLKFFFRQMLDQLREHGAARVHSALFHPARQPEKSRFWPFLIEIVLASTMRYHADLQWVRMAFRDFSRTVVFYCHTCRSPFSRALDFHVCSGSTLTRGAIQAIPKTECRQLKISSSWNDRCKKSSS